MSRIENIANYAKRREEEKAAKILAKEKRIEEYKNEILKLKPRIDELLAVGNACQKHKIPLTSDSGRENYKTWHFLSNSWSHLLGFIGRGGTPFREIGIIGGGACNFNLTTNGKFINVEGDVEYVLKRFLNEFDEFETEFYKYVDAVTAQ